MINEKILERIRNLLAMAADASSPNEAAIAARRARKLMDEYQLSASDLETSDFGSMAVGTIRKSWPVWEQSMAISIANLNDCIVRFYTTVGGKTLMFQGFEEDVYVCEFMYHYLKEACLRQFRLYDRQRKGDSRQYAAKFKLGFSVAITQLIRDMMEERKTVTASSGKSLMVMKKQLVEEKFSSAQYAKKTFSDEYDDSYTKGYIAGSKTNITTGIETDQDNQNHRLANNG